MMKYYATKHKHKNKTPVEKIGASRAICFFYLPFLMAGLKASNSGLHLIHGYISMSPALHHLFSNPLRSSMTTLLLLTFTLTFLYLK